MFNYAKSGKGVINGKWCVFYIHGEDLIPVKYFDEEYKAAEKATYLNNLVKEFIHLIIHI